MHEYKILLFCICPGVYIHEEQCVKKNLVNVVGEFGKRSVLSPDKSTNLIGVPGSLPGHHMKHFNRSY